MKNQFYIFASILIVCLSSCKKDESISFGTVEYYPSFLWVDSNITPVTKTFDFDFSQDAKDNDSFAEFQFVDNNGKVISTDVMQVIIDGKEIHNNRFRINSGETSKKLTFKFSPDAQKGKHQGYLKLVNHKLDRLDSQPLTVNQQVDAFQWTLNYDKGMNPLAKVLMWLGYAILTLFTLWFLFIKSIIYPRIRINRIEISSQNGYFVNKKINGARLVVITNNSKKQGWLNKLFTGKIIYIKNPIWTSTWELSPKGRKKVVKINLHRKYMISPVTSQLENFGEYQLTIVETNDSFIIKTL